MPIDTILNVGLPPSHLLLTHMQKSDTHNTLNISIHTDLTRSTMGSKSLEYSNHFTSDHHHVTATFSLLLLLNQSTYSVPDFVPRFDDCFGLCFQSVDIDIDIVVQVDDPFTSSWNTCERTQGKCW